MATTQTRLVGHDPKRTGALLARAGVTLGMSHRELATLVGVSRRSVSRWTREGTLLTRAQVVAVTKAVHPLDASLAAELAALLDETLVTLGLEAPPPIADTLAPKSERRAVSSARLADVVVCAAAEAMDVSPRLVRPALVAALRAAREVGLSIEALAHALDGGT